MTDGENVVHETAEGLGNQIAKAFVGNTVGVYLQHDTPDRDGDHLTDGATVDDITTEPDAPGYERLTLKNGENPTFDVDGFVGSLDHLFIVDDDGRLMVALPLKTGDEPVVVHDHMSELTPRIWGDDGED